MKKIAFIYDAIYPYVKGGGEMRYYELGKRLLQKGYEIHFYGMRFWKGNDVINHEGMYYHGLGNAKKLYTDSGKRSIWQAIYFGILCLKLLGEDFDIIDCCEFPFFPLFTCKLVCTIKRKKLFSTWHEVWGKQYWKDYVGNLYFLSSYVEKFSTQMPDQIISVSDLTKERIKNDLGSKNPVVVIPNGIEFDHIKHIKPSKLKSDIIYVGRLMDFKHIDILIRAVALTKQNFPKIRCVIIGDGPEKDKLIALAKKLHLEKNILFCGFLDNHDDLYSYMKSSKVFVFPSTREGFGIVVLEANACSLPVITVNHHNNAAKDLIIDQKNGAICSLSVTEIAQHIKVYLQHPSDASQVTNIAKSFNWESISSNLEAIYTSTG